MRWFMRLAWGVCISFAGSCGGGDGNAPHGMQPLVPDTAVITSCAPGVAAGASRAKPIACAEELMTGRLASGRIGDLVIENHRVRFVIRGPGEGYLMHGTRGGGIVDGGRAGKDDLIKEIQALADLHVGAYDELVIVEAGDDGPAEIAVRGPASLVPLLDAAIGGTPRELIVEQRYRLAPDSDALELQTILWPTGGATGGEDLATLADAVFLGGRTRAFVPGRGWFDGGTSGAEFLAVDGTDASYALVYPKPDVPAVQLIDVSGLRFVFGPTIRPGDPAGRTRWLVVGDGSIASVTGAAWALRGDPLGTIAHAAGAEPGVSIVVRDGDDLVTVGRVDPQGAFAIDVPPGAYTVTAEAPGRTPGPATPVTVAAGESVELDPAAGPTGAARVNVRLGAGPESVPARITVWKDGDRSVFYNGASPSVTIPLAPGTYRLAVSRGLEHDAFVVDPLVVGEGQIAEVDATINRVLDTTGWASVDTHLHSEMSSDSTIPLEDRVLAVAAEGVDLAISTDHDFLTDYAPVVADLELGAWVATAIGNEASSLVWGHLNAWPLSIEPNRAAQGAVAWFDRAPGDVYDELRGDDASRVVQINHPRNATSGLFAMIDFRPDTLTAGRDPVELGLPAGTDLADLGFDAVEVANETGGSFEGGFQDWIALANAGHPAAATGSSDSHGATAYAGRARTYVWVGPGADDPASLDVRAVNDAIRARHVTVATGAFVTAGLVDPATGAPSLIGELVDLSGETSATLRIRVQAPPWMPVGSIRIYAGTEVAATIAIDPASTEPVRYEGDTTLPLGTIDTLYVIRVDLAGDGDPVLGDGESSFTNPLLADVDGDGLFTR